MYKSRSDVEEMFKYHPPLTEERKQKHADINKAALDFALVLYEHITDQTLLDQAINQVQAARMIANQIVTYEEIVSRSS